ncbi:MAG: DUF445 domain-containing protein [Treponema sp.]|nr:DUF445 domain-containing protein [Treponema sp.]
MPVLVLIEIVISLGLGGFVGWITNVLAVNMLFKKYWKWGGVIEAQYDKFIINMSQLVETDLVNGKTLLTEFNAPPFKQVLHQWIEDILRKELPENSGAVRFAAIPGIETTVTQLVDLLESIEPSLLPGLFAELGTKEVKTLVSQKQYAYIINKNVSTLMANGETYQHALKHILLVFLEGKSIKNLISEGALRQIGKNSGAIIRNLNFADFDETSNTAYEQLLAAMDIDRVIRTLQQQLEAKKLIDFVDNPRDFSHALLTRLVDFTHAAEGQEVLHEIIKDFLSAARRIDVKLAEVVDPSVQEGILTFCTNQMPGIINGIIGFIYSSRTEIEAIINATVDKQLGKTFGGKIGKFFKDLFIGNLAHKVDVIEKIAHTVKEHEQEAGKELTWRLITLLQTKTIGEIIGMIQDSGLVKVQGIVDLINYNLKALPKKEVKVLDDLLEKRIGDCFGSIDLAFITTDLLPKVFTTIKQDYLFTDRFKEDICPLVNAKILELSQYALSDMVDIQAIPLTLHEAGIKNSLLNAWETLANIKIKDMVGDQVAKLSITKETWLGLWDRHKGRDLNQLYQAIQNNAAYTKIAEWILTVINQNLDTLLTGTISKVVADELTQLKPHEINTMVQDFMGKEMKSINILGAILGALVGGVSALAVSFMHLPKTFIWWILGVYGGIFALVGIGTNWLAIKMLFRPYKALLKGARFPPFLGIVAARKPEFAKNIAHFVKTRMLAEDALKQQFIKNQETVKKSVYTLVSDENYGVIDTIFQDEARLDSIAQGVFLGMQAYITEHRAEIAAILAARIKQLVAERKLDALIPELQRLIVKKLQPGTIASVIHKMIQKEIPGKQLNAYHKTIERFLDMHLKTLTERIIEEVSKGITVNQVKNFIDQYHEQFVSYSSTHTLADLAGTARIRDFSQNITAQIKPLFHDAIRPIVRYIEKQELSPDLSLRNLFNGAIPGILEKNMAYMIDILCREMRKTKESLVTSIKDAMPFYTIPWKGQVDPIVTALLDRELPEFLNRKRDHLLRITNTLLDNRLSNLGFNNHALKIETIERTVAGILDSPYIQEGVSQLVTIVMRQFTQIPLKTLLGLINIHHIQDITRILDPLLITGVSYVKENLSRSEVIEVIATLIKTILLDSLKVIPVANVVKDIDLEKELYGFVSLLTQDQTVMTEIARLIEDILFTVCRDPSFYDEATLAHDMADFIAHLDQDRSWDRLEVILMPAFKEFFVKLNSVITPETKDQICDHLISAMISGGIDNFSRIMQSINVDFVVQREINAMHPRGIETLFNKFAGTYFTKIILYGWIGLFGGILSYLISYGLGKVIK